MKSKISLKRSISLYLQEWTAPVITDYQLGSFLFCVFKKGTYKRHKISVESIEPQERKFSDRIQQLLEDGILIENEDFPQNNVFNILGAQDKSAEEVVCTVDPFAYVSHLSAMDFHGLTDRNSKTLYISRPNTKVWKSFAQEQMKKELGEYYDEYTNSSFPRLKRLELAKINKRAIHSYSSSHLGAFKNVHDRMIRVSTIGRVFLEMLREPNLCGGIEHVLDVYEEHATRYLKLILNEIDRHGKPIDKVRAGYILNEYLNLDHETIQKWETYVQRGGSRKLDPSQEYSTQYSEKWCLSINTVRKCD